MRAAAPMGVQPDDKCLMVDNEAVHRLPWYKHCGQSLRTGTPDG